MSKKDMDRRKKFILELMGDPIYQPMRLREISSLLRLSKEEKRELIFDRFYQMEQGSGIGIGLHLAREIVTLHQGTLKVVDRSGLEGATTFQFILPKMIAKDHAQEEINLTIS